MSCSVWCAVKLENKLMIFTIVFKSFFMKRKLLKKFKQSPYRNILFCLLRDEKCDKLILSKLQELIYRTGF